MAESINLASEQRKVEQEFKLLDNFNLGGREKEDPYSWWLLGEYQIMV